MDILALIALFHCFVLSLIILFSKFFRGERNRYLGITLLIISVVGLNNWFWDRNLNPLIINVLDLFLWQFLYPVTFVIFFYASSNHTGKKLKIISLLLTPFIILSACNILISLSTVFTLYSLPAIINDRVTLFYQVVSFLSIIFPVYTIALSYKFTLSYKDDLSKKWLKYLWAFLSLIMLYGVFLEAHRFIYSEKLPLTNLWTFISIFLYWLIYKGIYEFKLSNEQYEIRALTKKKNASSSNSTLTRSTLFNKLIELLEKERIHHNPNLSRDEVADRLGISNGYLSEIIKDNTNSNFSDLINSYRVQDVKDMISDPRFEKYNLVSIGLESGFNSKTSFNTNFKKLTGLTPKEFRGK